MRNTCRKSGEGNYVTRGKENRGIHMKKKAVKEGTEIIIGDEDAEGKQVKATWRRRKDVRRNST